MISSDYLVQILYLLRIFSRKTKIKKVQDMYKIFFKIEGQIE